VRPLPDSMASAPTLRPQIATDLSAIDAINTAAFADHGGTAAFDRFRAERTDILSLVALHNDKLIGHVLFSPVIMQTPAGPATGMGLGQLAVLPDWQNQGVGKKLTESGIAELRGRKCPFIIVVGHATYYPRFGFELGALHNVQCQWAGVPDKTFMVLYLSGNRQEQQQLTGVASFDGL
jgi:putative acetyltransferase